MATTRTKTIDQQYITGIVNNDKKILEKVYREYLSKITTMVKRNSGSPDEAKDIFQEAIIIIFRRAKEADFELTQSFYSYLYGVSRFLWLRQLKKKHRKEVSLDASLSPEAEQDIVKDIEEREQKKLFRDKLESLGKECKQLLKRFFEGIPLKQIATELDYTENYIKKKKYNCKEELVKRIRADQRFKELQ